MAKNDELALSRELISAIAREVASILEESPDMLARSFVSKLFFKEQFGMLMRFFNENKGRIVTAGISGKEMIQEISRVLGTDWQTGGGAEGVADNFVDGFAVKYSSATAAAVTAGNIKANGKLYSLAADAIHGITSLAAGADFHYLYIDDDASSPPSATIIDSTTEPSYDPVRRGWYNGDDRTIGPVWSPAASTTISYFDKAGEGKNISYVYGVQELLRLAINMNPNFTWQTPNENESSVAVPVNATKIYIRTEAADAGAACAFYAASSEMAAINTNVTRGQVNVWGFDMNTTMETIILGPSRNIKLAGVDDDDNRLSAHAVGFEMAR